VNMGEELRAQVQHWLTNWFLSRSKPRSKPGKPTSVPLDVDYFEAGWLTSMEVVEFVTEIEQTFGMQFSDRDLQDPRFVTIAGLTELIVAYSTGTSESR
jgi:acyl carrier protein